MKLSGTFRIITLSGIFILLSACNDKIADYKQKIISGTDYPNGVNAVYPRDSTIFPPEMLPPAFTWEETDSKVTNWQVWIEDSVGQEITSATVSVNTWQPDSASWQKIKQHAPGKNLLFYVVGSSIGLFGKKYSSLKICFSISIDSVGAPIFFRAVPLPFGYAVTHVDKIKWYMGKAGDKKPKKMLENVPVCANCHSFPRDGSLLAMDVDYANDKGSYAIAPARDSCKIDFNNIITWNDYKRFDGEDTYGLLSQISPDGKNVLSTVKDRSVFVAIDNNMEYSQLFFPIKGILVNYNRETGKYLELMGANDKKYVQSNPSWSPDSKEIIFTRAERYRSEKIDRSKSVLLSVDDANEFIQGKKDFKFDLYRLKFNNGKGSQALPLEGASNNNKSNFFARYSPDGKWIVFCMADNFMLLQPDSKLYIMPASGGVPRLMNCNNEKMNSWHSWSPNGKWLVFSSKQQGAYTKLYLTHIDENGNDSPPVFLENLAFDSMAVNIPEFFAGKENDFIAINDGFSNSAQYYTRLASNSIKNAEYSTALSYIDKALAIDNEYIDAYIQRIKANKLLRQSNIRKFSADKSTVAKLIASKLNKNPANQELFLNRGNLHLLTNDYQAAIKDAKLVISINPLNYEGYELLTSALRLSNKHVEAIPYYETMANLYPDNEKQFMFFLGSAYQKTGKAEKSLQIFNSIIEKYPTDFGLYLGRASVESEIGDVKAALNDIQKAIDLAPANYIPYKDRYEFYKSQGKTAEARKDLEKAVELISGQVNPQKVNTDLLFSRAELLETAGMDKEAFDDYSTILNSWPENYFALQQTARLSLRTENWQAAIDAYTRLIANYPAESEFYNNLGMVYIRIQKPDEALNCFNKALELDKQNIDLLFNRAQLYLNLNEKTNAVADLKLVKTMLDAKAKSKLLNKNQESLLIQVNKMLQLIE